MVPRVRVASSTLTPLRQTMRARARLATKKIPGRKTAIMYSSRIWLRYRSSVRARNSPSFSRSLAKTWISFMPEMFSDRKLFRSLSFVRTTR